MLEPIKLDVPHNLGREAARAKIAGRIDKLEGMIPGGGSVEHRWDGDILHFDAAMMGQVIACRIDVLDDKAHVEVRLPPALGLFLPKVRDKLLSIAPKLLT